MVCVLWEVQTIGIVQGLLHVSESSGEMGQVQIGATEGQLAQGIRYAEASCRTIPLLVHPLGARLVCQRLVMKSRMMGDHHVRFCEGLGVQFPRSTRLNLSQRFVTVHAARFARLRMNRANSASQVKRMFERRFAQ